jgi:hypothetical protein
MVGHTYNLSYFIGRYWKDHIRSQPREKGSKTPISIKKLGVVVVHNCNPCDKA